MWPCSMPIYSELLLEVELDLVIISTNSVNARVISVNPSDQFPILLPILSQIGRNPATIKITLTSPHFKLPLSV